MSTDALALLSDLQLVNLFATSTTLALTQRAKQVMAELERRGYIFDAQRGDFVTCEQWNLRHGGYLPMDCYEQDKKRGRHR